MDRLLLIDDEESILVAMAEYFAALGYAVDCAADDASARALVDRQDYRVVVTDLSLSRNDGLEGFDIVERVRRRRPQTVCIVLTAHGCASVEERARQRGVSAFLGKPVPLDEIAAVVAALTRRSVAGLPPAPPLPL